MRLGNLIGLVLGASLLGLPGVGAAQKPCNSIAFIGELGWIKLYPQREPVKTRSLPDRDEITITNSCGNSETKFDVIRLLVGPPVTSLTIYSDLDEWCHTPVPIDVSPMLVTATKQDGEWVMEASVQVKKDNAGAGIILPDTPYPKTFLGISTDQIRKPLKHPIFAAEAKDLSGSYDVRMMVKRGLWKRIGKQFDYVSAVYISDLSDYLRKEPDLREQNCIPNTEKDHKR